MRHFIAASVIIGAAVAQTAKDIIACAEAAISNGDTYSFSNCDGKSAQDCFCSNSDAISSLSPSTASACSGIDINTLIDSLCPSNSTSTSTAASRETHTTPFRHASKPMERVQAPNAHMNMNMERAYAPAEPAVPRVVYVTETRTDCSCKTTPASMAHVSQIPVNVPASSSMSGMIAASSAAPSASYSHGMMVNAASSSVVFGSQASAATPSPSGVDANRFSSFQGAGAKSVSVHGGVAALGVAAVMALMAAL
ncbi:hypothetical protein N7499_010024 [Penicillium canescens]|uniref:Extracellular membrane protein CFEM domain-containing protein n=1 Tax=Penicillium canescens TaxID=5083 RepID=A0AAD6NE11_PENCN|nr:uncharacterized protein N7446_007957 [Penicillium canescens]KAJ6018794.1 hypothetical protein N7522_000861 [Penicillium canescens]KAJ6033749.1 hypothetical protein N7444_011520 [Penicillium canescens]KAJ6057056.1 hypothetical protein N7460_000330 [Penicillium canescens]KAJ6058374.1 hypothetical protein N7446_007957 [Penicillium canescens]KAJ6072010.1 hypothetical protein N7499_010024 [Penicillium canescens]